MQFIFHDMDEIIHFIDIQTQCMKWMDYKNYCLGVFPNIHNINI